MCKKFFYHKLTVNNKNILILNPSNDDELKFLFHKFKKIKTPTYFRINKTPYKNTFGFIRKRNFF